MAENPHENVTPSGEPTKANEVPSPELRALEAALAALVPRPANFDRDRFMFAAGQASVNIAPTAARHRLAWPAAFSAMSALAASLLLALLLRPPVVVERLVQAPVVSEIADTGDQLVGATPQESGGAMEPSSDLASRPSTPPSLEPSYIDLRDRVLAMGIDAWQAPAHLGQAQSQPPATYRDMLIDLERLH